MSVFTILQNWKKNIIHANSVIGSDGLGFAKNENSWEKIEHLDLLKLKMMLK